MTSAVRTSVGAPRLAAVPAPRASVSIVIACRDEAPTIGDIVRRCHAYSGEILVVDGHSRDETREVAERAGARVLLDGRRGKGDAVRVGLQQATGDIVVFIDADGSHDPDDIPRLVQPLLEDRADLVVASRMRGGSDEFHGDLGEIVRMIGGAIITAGINYRFGVKLSDAQNGFRAIRAEAARGLGLVEDITTIEQEMVIKALRRGLRVSEVPSHEYARSHGESRIQLGDVWHRYVYSWLKNLAARRDGPR
ncbi:MAG TPA: glycosyltransferase family 2 protein [Polyangiaceae bacterium]